MLGSDPADQPVEPLPDLNTAGKVDGVGVIGLQHDDLGIGCRLLQGGQDVVQVLANLGQHVVTGDAGGIEVAVISEQQVDGPDRQGDRADLAPVGAQERHRGVQLRARIADVQGQAGVRGPEAPAIDHRVGRLARAAEVDHLLVGSDPPHASGKVVGVAGVERHGRPKAGGPGPRRAEVRAPRRILLSP
jgi:hypothetical protein